MCLYETPAIKRYDNVKDQCDSGVLQQVLDDGTDPWGVQVERVEM